jgi:hypothetical protein
MNHAIKRQNNIPITLNRIPNRRAVLQQRSCQGKDANANRRRQDCRLRAPHEVEPDVTHELKQTRSPRPRPEPWSRPFSNFSTACARATLKIWLPWVGPREASKEYVISTSAGGEGVPSEKSEAELLEEASSLVLPSSMSCLRVTREWLMGWLMPSWKRGLVLLALRKSQ